MRILLSVLVGLIICAAAAAGIYQYRAVPSPTVTATPQTERNAVPPATPPSTDQKSDTSAPADQSTDASPAQTTGNTPAIDQPTPIPPTPLEPRTVKTESIVPTPDEGAGTMAQQNVPAKTHMKKRKKHVAYPKKRQPSTRSAATGR